MARNKTSKAWMHQHVSDLYVRQAQKEGYRSRAAYKLIELAARDRMFRPGMIVVDLGAAPGGWSQVAARRVHPRGRVVAMDRLPMEPISGVEFLQADFADDDGIAALRSNLGEARVDLVLSDMAPNLSGVKAVDQARCAELAELVIEFARLHLKPDGALLVKAFQGAHFDQLRRAMHVVFRDAQVRKPKASRSESKEIYLLGRGVKPSPQSKPSPA